MHTSPSLPPLDGLLAVIAAHRTGSFSAAAEMLGITHGAVSRRVHAVEHWLSTPLFERHGRGVKTTPAGQRFVATAEQALATLRNSADLWRPGRELPIVRVTAVPSVVRLWLMSKMRSLQASPADTRVELQSDHRVVDLDDDEADIAIRYGAGRWKRATAHLLFGERLFPVAAPAVAAELGPAPKPEQIARCALLHDSDTRQWRAWLAAHGIRHRAKSDDRRFEDYDLVLAAAAAELGIALLRSPLADSFVSSGRLVRLSRATIADERNHYLVLRADETRTSVLRVADRLKACAAGMAL